MKKLIVISRKEIHYPTINEDIVKIQACSDLHLEFGDIHLKNAGCDLLVLAGDVLIADTLKKKNAGQPMRDFIQRVSDEFPKVVYVMGNHDFYNEEWNHAIDIIEEACVQFPNVRLLENNFIELDDIMIIGATLWTDMNKKDPLTMHTVALRMSDFHIIRKAPSGPYTSGYSRITPIDTVIRHNQSLDFIKRTVRENNDKKVVVVSHHAPCPKSIKACFKDDHYMNGGYSTDLSNFILDNPNIRVWIHGHTHTPFDYEIGATRIFCNPRGYDMHEDTGWDSQKLIYV